MSLGHGASIVRNGLIFHYDLGNTQKSWKGAPTTNLAPYTDYSNRTYDSKYDIGGWGGDDADVYYYRNGGWNGLPYKKMIKHTSGTGGSYINEHSYFTLVEGKTYVISCYMKANINVTVSGHTLALNRDSDNAYRVPADISLTTSWTRYVWTYTCAAGEGGTTYHFRQIVYNDANLPVEVYWSALQIEEGTVASPYVNGTRSSTGAIIDLTRNTTLTASSLTYNSDGTFGFDGVANILSAATMPSMSNTNFSCECVFNASSFAAAPVVVCPLSAGIDHFVRVDTTGKVIFQLTTEADIGNRGYTSAAVLQTNATYHVVCVKDGSTVQIYINGVLDTNASDTLGTASWGGAQWSIGQRGNGQFPFAGRIPVVRAYNKSLTAVEVRQNFEAVRTRYGI